jgi:UDP-hydrolysing UDP-N-acetyl-D-glucosamine 2-epimerase
MTHRVCVVTGTRAEYGLLRYLMEELRAMDGVQLQVLATGAHLSPEFGLTYRAIEADGFTIDERVEMLLSSDTAVGVAKSMGLGVIGFADAFARLAPDMIVVLGDRFEMLAAAQTAMVLQIPIAHLGGGDIGAGTYDNVIRPCLTKMASLHFVTHAEARQRVVQLGEDPERVFCFGATNVDAIMRAKLLSRDELAASLEVPLEETILAVTFHPLTMDDASSVEQLHALLHAIAALRHSRRATVVFTMANADNGGRAINQTLANWVAENPGCHLFASLGQTRYLSLLKQASAVIGNSSSGIYEAPYLSTPTVDIGSRQRGRAAPVSVFRCEPTESAIRIAIDKALGFEFRDVEMVYGDGNASPRIASTIREHLAQPNRAIKTTGVA